MDAWREALGLEVHQRAKSELMPVDTRKSDDVRPALLQEVPAAGHDLSGLLHDQLPEEIAVLSEVELGRAVLRVWLRIQWNSNEDSDCEAAAFPGISLPRGLAARQSNNRIWAGKQIQYYNQVVVEVQDPHVPHRQEVEHHHELHSREEVAVNHSARLTQIRSLTISQKGDREIKSTKQYAKFIKTKDAARCLNEEK